MQFIDLKKQYNLIKEDTQKRINQVLEHGQYIQGPEVQELEEKLAAFVGAKHCIGVSSGTDALFIALMALSVGPGDEVITTPFSFIATAEVIALLGARPVFVDIDKNTYNINPDKIEEKITEKTKAIMPVSLYGQCSDMDAINQVAAKHNLPVIEDGAQSFGATYKGLRSCGISTIGCTSFFPSKPLGGYGDGGAIFCENDELAIRMRRIMNHGQDVRYNHPMLGVNGRLDTLQAAVLLSKMGIFENEVNLRQKVGARYTDNLKDIAGTPFVAPDNTHVYAQYTIQVPNRDEFQKKMQEKGIPTAIHYPKTMARQPVFAELIEQDVEFPVSDDLADRVISLPMHPYLEESDQDKIIEAVKECSSN